MKKLLCGAAALCLLLANNGSCLGGPVQSPSDVPASSQAARLCAEAARAGAAADVIAQALIATHVAENKVAALVPLIQAGRLLIDSSCAVLLPPSEMTHDGPVVSSAT